MGCFTRIYPKKPESRYNFCSISKLSDRWVQGSFMKLNILIQSLHLTHFASRSSSASMVELKKIPPKMASYFRFIYPPGDSQPASSIFFVVPLKVSNELRQENLWSILDYILTEQKFKVRFSPQSFSVFPRIVWSQRRSILDFFQRCSISENEPSQEGQTFVKETSKFCCLLPVCEIHRVVCFRNGNFCSCRRLPEGFLAAVLRDDRAKVGNRGCWGWFVGFCIGGETGGRRKSWNRWQDMKELERVESLILITYWAFSQMEKVPRRWIDWSISNKGFRSGLALVQHVWDSHIDLVFNSSM